MENVALSVRELKVSYRTIKPMNVKNIFSGKARRSSKFEALHGVSFDVEKGEILGIVGENGSGKSTLLRAVAGIFSPDSGSVDTFGNSVALLAIGVGFKKALSGRENILLSGLLLGFSKKQITEKMDEIIDFSGLRDFIDAPVSTYSSGMHSKLAFSITAVLEPDMLLIDEVFSVGDKRFQKKSYDKMRQLISSENRTVIIVSHSLETLKKLCTRILWLDSGNVKMIGRPKEVLKAYSEYMS
ncbi:MAG: ABC transporter ATP-binding protein [Eubacteriales bacterium]|nr:ATP-binding cassette domain-containing protein [Clostridiales bacterium]